MPQIAITGATGFLGRRCAEVFSRAGHAVKALGRNPIVLKELAEDGLTVHRCDLADQNGLRYAFAGCDTVVHCAALSSLWGRAEAFHAANVQGTAEVIQACRAADVGRLIHISTPSVYMERRDRLDIREGDPLPRRFINAYASTKFQAEELLRQSGMETIILRPQGIFGPRDRAILPRLLRIGQRGIIPCFGDGLQQIDLTYVDNVVDAIQLAVAAPKSAAGRVYNITNGEPVVQLSLIEDVLRRLGMPVRRKRLPWSVLYPAAWITERCHALLRSSVEPTLTVYGLCMLAYSRTLNIDAAQRELGYRPHVCMAEGIDRLVTWSKHHGSH